MSASGGTRDWCSYGGSCGGAMASDSVRNIVAYLPLKRMAGNIFSFASEKGEALPKPAAAGETAQIVT